MVTTTCLKGIRLANAMVLSIVSTVSRGWPTMKKPLVTIPKRWQIWTTRSTLAGLMFLVNCLQDFLVGAFLTPKPMYQQPLSRM